MLEEIKIDVNEKKWQGHPRVKVVGQKHLPSAEKMTPEMLERLCEAIRSVERARAVVLCGAGDAFCSGFDLAMCLKDATVLPELLKGLSRAIQALRAHRSPIVAAVHGAAIAGGCALVVGADVVITHDDAKLGYPVVKLGISPAVNAPFLVPALGAGATRARLLDTSLISGLEALRLGLAHECVATAGEVLPRAMKVAMELAEKPRSGIEATKTLLNELDGTDDANQIQASLNASLALVGSDEERERISKLFAKERS